MPRIEITTKIEAPVESVFDLARSINVHAESQSRYRERAIAGKTSGLIEEGESVTWEAVHFGIRWSLSSRIVKMTRPSHFRDSMLSGPFEAFDHDHYFEKLSNGTTLMSDVFSYTAPWRFFGKFANILFLKRHMRVLIEERNAFIKKLAESSPR